MRGLASQWTVYPAIGTFLPYLLGYLSLRFHFTAIGITTDLDVWDDAKSRDYLLAAFPTFLMVAAVLFGAAVPVGYSLLRILPVRVRSQVVKKWKSRSRRNAENRSRPALIAELGLERMATFPMRDDQNRAGRRVLICVRSPHTPGVP
jgi:hypothetical protein